MNKILGIALTVAIVVLVIGGAVVVGKKALGS